MTLPSPPLLLITDRLQARGDIYEIAELALLAGCRWLSLRERDLPPAEQSFLLRKIMQRAERRHAKVTLHGDAKLARDAGAEGVHLAAGSDAAEARRLFGDGGLIGISVHGAEEACGADPAVLDYVVAGPVFETASKPGYGPALGTDGLGRIVQACRVPVIAIGGITAENAAECLGAGVGGIAVMGGVMRAKDPAGAVAQLLGALGRQPRPR